MEKTLEIHQEELREQIAQEIEKAASVFLKTFESKDNIVIYRIAQEAFRISAAVAREEE